MTWGWEKARGLDPMSHTEGETREYSSVIIGCHTVQ